MKDNKIFTKAIFFFSCLIFILIVYNLYFFIKYPYLGTDSGFYLSVARDVYQGDQYFTEIASSYNPLSIIIIGIPFLFYDDPDGRMFLLVNIIIMIISTKILYNIFKENFKNTKQINVLFSLIFFLGYLVFDGRYILLEPSSVMFQLLAFYLYLKSKTSQKLFFLFFVGFFISLSFYSKQFGLFLLIPIFMDILIYKNKWFKKLTVLAMGFILPILILFVYYANYGVSTEKYLLYIIGKGIEFDKGIGTGSTIGIFDLFISMIYFILFNLYLLLIPIAFFKLKEIKNKDSFIFIFSAISSLLVLYFASYFHYFLYILPFFIILTAYVFQHIKAQRHKIIFIVSLFISSSLLFVYSFLSNQTSFDKYNNQKETLVELQKSIPEKSKVYIVDPSKAYYFLGQFNSINSKKIGYCFPNYFYSKTICENLTKDSFLILSSEKLNDYKEYLKNYSLTEVIIENKKYIIIKIL